MIEVKFIKHYKLNAYVTLLSNGARSLPILSHIGIYVVHFNIDI